MSEAAPFLDIREYLRSVGDEVVHLRPNIGNAGDALIAEATFQLLEECGVVYRIWRDGDDSEGKTLLYGGGGCFVPLYGACADFIARHHRRAKKLIVLPHTIDGHEKLLSELGPNVELLCRERISYRHVRRSAPGCEAHLADDLALHLDVRSIRARKRPSLRDLFDVPRFWPGTAIFRGQLALYRRLSRRSVPGVGNDEPILHCFRRDLERTDHPIPRYNVDVSTRVPHDEAMLDRKRISRTTQELLHFIDAFSLVATNRLHVGIAAALLGKQVHLYENSYWKNRAVYEASLAERFENVSWRS